MKQGGPRSLPLDRLHSCQLQRDDFQGQTAARKQTLGWGYAEEKPGCQQWVSAENMHLLQGATELGAGSEDRGKGGASLG